MLLSKVGNTPAGSRWRCCVRRVGLPLALAAVAFQLAFLFGHHHFELSGDRLGSVPATSALLQTGQATPALDDSRQGQAPAHAPCVLCLAIHASASLDATAPQLVLAIAYERQPVSRRTGAPIMPPLRVAAFDSRGPPRV